MASVGRAPYKKSRRFVFHKINDLALEREPISLFCYLSVSPISVFPLFSPLPHPHSPWLPQLCSLRACLCHSLDSTDKCYHMVLVFLFLAYLT